MIDTHSPQPSGTHSRQTGASLIEVLVAVFVLAFGVLGIAAMQAGALRNNQGALEQSTAVFLTHSILDAMRASMVPDPADPGRFVVRPGYVTGGFICGVSAAPDNLVSNDINRWLQDIRDNLNGGANDGNACGRIVCNANDCTASVQWNNSRSLGGNQAQVVATRSRL
ncbi:MAG: type IV pilus modification protein PilV [Azoarcus sp.]|jgi:type IV pilus assembly protein PilV|nr:type IV pilus modification protein PilV [Azoarcus sp.]